MTADSMRIKFGIAVYIENSNQCVIQTERVY